MASGQGELALRAGWGGGGALFAARVWVRFVKNGGWALGIALVETRG